MDSRKRGRRGCAFDLNGDPKKSKQAKMGPSSSRLGCKSKPCATLSSTSGCPFSGRNNVVTQMMNPSSSSIEPNVKRKNFPGNRSDVGWEHCFEVDRNPRKVRCKYCEKIIGGVYRLKHHLAGSHKDTGACLEVPEDVKNIMKEYVLKAMDMSIEKKREFFGSDTNGVEIEAAFVERSNENVQPQKECLESVLKKPTSSMEKTRTTNQKDLREEVHQQISKFFFTSAIPLNCVENPEFVKMCQLIERYGIGLEPPSYHEVGEKYLNEEIARIQKLHEEHKEQLKKTGCSIILNDWTKKKGVCNFLVNSPKGTIFLSSIDTSKSSNVDVFKKLDDIIEEVGEENVVQVITDDHANYKAVEKFLEKRKMILWTPCAAYCIDLMLEDFGKKLKIHCWTIDKAKMITKYIYARIKVIEMLKHFTKGKDLVRPAITRFATSYLTLECFNNNKDALINMFDSNTWNLSKFAVTEDGHIVQSLVKNSRFWKNVETCLKAAFPLIKVLQLVDSDKKPPMGFIYEEMDRAKKNIQVNFENVEKRYEPVWKIIDERWKSKSSHRHRVLYLAAYYLNPQFHYSPNFNANVEVIDGLYKCLEKMIPDKYERAKIHVQLDEFKARKGLFGSEIALMTKERKSPAMWWDSYGAEFPELQKFAIQILSLTCSSSGCERNWSAFERVHTDRRNHLCKEKMNDLIFVMFNLKLKDKQARKSIEMDSFEDMPFDNEWIVNERTNCSEHTHEGRDDEGDFVIKEEAVD